MKKKHGSDENIISRKKLKRYMVFAGAFLIVFLIATLYIHKFISFQVKLRDESRQAVMREVVEILESEHTETGAYPKAVFFTKDEVLICSQVNCFREQKVRLSGASRSSSDLENKTTKKFTRYVYELADDGYKLGYCNEFGEIRNFGNSSIPPAVVCH